MPASALYSKLHTDSEYKLLQLDSTLLKALENEGKLAFKAAKESDSVVLCSKSNTWTLKQKNHSNTVLVMREFVPDEIPKIENWSSLDVREPSGFSLGFTKQSYELEPRLTTGEINYGTLPIYSGEAHKVSGASGLPSATCLSLEDLRKCSPCSDEEFAQKWPALGGCVVNGVACILSREFVSRALHITLMSCMAESLSFEDLDESQAFAAVNKDMGEAGEFNPFSKEVISTILGKFCSRSPLGKFKLQKETISQWYGIEALKKFASRVSIPQDEFMIKWKSLFPPYFSCDLDFRALRGYYYRPLGSCIQYFSKETLPDDPKERFSYLFKLQSTWDLDEIAPFIDQLNTKGIKIESFVMKYARRKRQGKRITVSAR
ncbi:LAQU0S02e04258g1_1 [Lachancea quebecensis]|uniref:LAQU0S02e04258g1_1 n=1 Tax=Lachancea quebecensis TaxID=1654605 RepID=A0A0N7ML17_9SACH|nr:LAQU0S02e04258g1_1 [Lachancea quebecensis]